MKSLSLRSIVRLQDLENRCVPAMVVQATADESAVSSAASTIVTPDKLADMNIAGPQAISIAASYPTPQNASLDLPSEPQAIGVLPINPISPPVNPNPTPLPSPSGPLVPPILPPSPGL